MIDYIALLSHGMIGPPFSMCLKTTAGSVVGNPAGDGHWDQEKGASVCFLFEACPSNKAVRIFEVGAITQVVSEPAMICVIAGFRFWRIRLMVMGSRKPGE